MSIRFLYYFVFRTIFSKHFETDELVHELTKNDFQFIQVRLQIQKNNKFVSTHRSFVHDSGPRLGDILPINWIGRFVSNL